MVLCELKMLRCLKLSLANGGTTGKPRKAALARQEGGLVATRIYFGFLRPSNSPSRSAALGRIKFRLKENQSEWQFFNVRLIEREYAKRERVSLRQKFKAAFRENRWNNAVLG